MVTASEMKSITNSSKKKFAGEISRIEKEMTARAEGGFSTFNTNTPIEIAQEVRDELTMNGYKVKNTQDDKIIIEW